MTKKPPMGKTVKAGVGKTGTNSKATAKTNTKASVKPVPLNDARSLAKKAGAKKMMVGGRNRAQKVSEDTPV